MFTKILAVCLLAIVASLGNAIELDEGVLVLEDGNFDDAIAENSNLLVEFYAPWCGHCKALAPEYAKAAKTLDKKGSVAKLGKVDATVEKNLQSRFSIKGFPTLKFFKNGKESEYTGGRTEAEIVQWLEKKTGPAFVTVASTEDLDSLKEKHGVFTLGVFSDADSANAKAFISLAEGDDDMTYAMTTDASVKSGLSVDGDHVIILKKFDNLRDDLAVTSFDEETVSSFISSNSVPLMQEFSQETSKQIFSSKIQQHVLIFTDKEADHHKSTIDTYTSVAPTFKGKTLFVNVPAEESRVLEFFGIEKSDLPKMIIGDLSSGAIKKYFYEGGVDASEIESFVNDFLDGKLKPSLKSEKASPADLEGDVKVVVGESFDDIVINNTKDVLVEFYAPWCGHCKKLAPIFDDLGAKFKDNDNIVIAKMDSTANEIDVAGVDVKGFPTLFFFKGDDKKNPVQYEGGRELDNFVEYLEKNVHNSISKDEL